ncbi:MAG: NIPSNAP family protein [Pirellulales bacterium]
MKIQMRKWTLFLGLLAGLCLVVAGRLAVEDASARAAENSAKPKAAASRLFEMRIYTTAEGKLGDLHKRFRDHTNKLFVKHGMTLVGYWTPAEGPEAKNTLVYILAYPNREAREKSWKAFQADPDWTAAREASEKNGRIVTKVVSQFMNPTDYSPIQ